MKKLASFIALILVFAFTVVLASCRSNRDGKDDTSNTTQDPEYVVVTTPEPDTNIPTSGPETTKTPDTTKEPETTKTPETTKAPETTVKPEDIKWTEAKKTVYVSVSNAWIRKAPNLDDSTRIVVLHLGDTLECTATSKDWIKVTYGGAVCYISSSCVTSDNISGNDFESVSDTVYVTVDSVWLRLGPSTDTEALQAAVKGTELKRVAKNGSWSKVMLDGKTYYVSNSCISTTKPVKK